MSGWIQAAMQQNTIASWLVWGRNQVYKAYYSAQAAQNLV